MKHYELTYTISEKLTPEEADKLLERVISYLPGQPIKKEAGYSFFNLEFYAEPEIIADLEKKLKSESQIKKCLVVKKETARTVKTRVRKIPAPMPAEIPPEEQRVEKADLKEIDKKLKEIFGE